MTAILGLDPAAHCGYAHTDGHHGVWNLTTVNDRHPGRRLERFRRILYAFKREHEIEVVATENAGMGSGRNPQVMALHNELRGIIKLCAAEWDIHYLEINPKTLKKWLTGNGNATKSEMIRWVSRRFDITTVDDNIADAVAVMEHAREMAAHGRFS